MTPAYLPLSVPTYTSCDGLELFCVHLRYCDTRTPTTYPVLVGVDRTRSNPDRRCWAPESPTASRLRGFPATASRLC